MFFIFRRHGFVPVFLALERAASDIGRRNSCCLNDTVLFGALEPSVRSASPIARGERAACDHRSTSQSPCCMRVSVLAMCTHVCDTHSVKQHPVLQ